MVFFFKKLEVNLMEAWDDEGKAIISSLSWKKLPIPNNKGSSTKCTYYMMLTLLQHLKARRKGPDVILDGGKWFTAKDVEELWGVVYKIIKDTVLVEWRKESPDKNETMYERPC